MTDDQIRLAGVLLPLLIVVALTLVEQWWDWRNEE